MANPLFSTYTQGENRVTSTLISVFDHISSGLTEDVLETVLDESDLTLVSFDNQIVGTESVPDAAIRSSTALWFETKTESNAVNRNQLERHLGELNNRNADLQRLIVLTPDYERPVQITAIDDDRLVWVNFDSLITAIESVLERDVGTAEQTVSIPTEREAFLLRELVRFLYDEELVSGREDRVLVVAARKAWPEFEKHELYFCQPNRSFKPVDYLAFYTDGEIKPIISRVSDWIESIELSTDAIEASTLSGDFRERLLRVVSRMNTTDSQRYGDEQKVAFLDRDGGIVLDNPVENNKTASDSDRRVAFVQGHRYVSLSKLKQNPRYTSELEEN